MYYYNILNVGNKIMPKIISRISVYNENFLDEWIILRFCFFNL